MKLETSTTSAWLLLFKAGVRREIATPAALFSQGAFLWLVLFIFSRLWESAFRSGFSASESPADYVWYLLVTELVILCSPQIFRNMQKEVRSGDVIQRFMKPVAYPGLFYFEGLGIAMVRLLFLGSSGSVFAALFSGGLPQSAVGFVTALVLVPFAISVLLLFYASIGLLSIWMYDAMPVYWIFSKANFVLGGLMIPVSVYPLWLQKISVCTPFYAILFSPASHVLLSTTPGVGSSLCLLCLWFIVGVALLGWLYDRMASTIELGWG